MPGILTYCKLTAVQLPPHEAAPIGMTDADTRNSAEFRPVAPGIGGDNKFALIRDVIHKHTGLTPAPALPPPSIHAYGKVKVLRSAHLDS